MTGTRGVLSDGSGRVDELVILFQMHEQALYAVGGPPCVT